MKKIKFLINGNPYELSIKSLSDESALVECNGMDYEVELVEVRAEQKTPKLIRKNAAPASMDRVERTHKPTEHVGSQYIKAPIPGTIISVLIEPGDSVEIGQVVAKMEAMKMENNIMASSDGVVKSVDVKPGSSVLEGDVLITLED
ncbi:MAG TPA: biotin/lipoyl-binding protein [Candidatus Marinimicrobia bacterium]|nr:biotin/lipoyl-binding protein [Candidatus Neomarinimicrobiota bacterium]